MVIDWTKYFVDNKILILINTMWLMYLIQSNHNKKNYEVFYIPRNLQTCLKFLHMQYFISLLIFLRYLKKETRTVKVSFNYKFHRLIP